MFIHKSIYHRNYNYSHPLAGKIYENQTFAQNFSQFVEEDIKLSTAGSEEHQRVGHLKKTSEHDLYFTRREEIPKRQTFSANRQATQDITKRRGTAELSRQTFSSKNATPYSGSLHLNRLDKSLKPKLNEEVLSKRGTPRDRKRLKRKMAINHFVDSYLFPSI